VQLSAPGFQYSITEKLDYYPKFLWIRKTKGGRVRQRVKGGVSGVFPRTLKSYICVLLVSLR